MPQASLLSYFSKPITSVSTELESGSKERSKQDDDARGNAESLTSAIIEQAPGFGIIEELHRRSAKGVVSGSIQCEATDATLESSSTGDKDPGKSPDRFAPQHRPEASQVIPISHLPGALITTVQRAHFPSIQRLTSTTLPVSYGEAFFTSTLSDATSFQLSRVALYASEPIGWIRCRLEPCSPQHSASLSKRELSQIYIQVLALLSPYRSLGIATMLLDAVLGSVIAKADNTVCIYAHVWEKNADALDWYAKRGFKRVILVEKYYRRLRPAGAWIVRKELDEVEK